MKLTRDKFDALFREYREHLQREVGRFRDAASVFRQIDERRDDYLREPNLAPGLAIHDDYPVGRQAFR